jgi:hypothetical protein
MRKRNRRRLRLWLSAGCVTTLCVVAGVVTNSAFAWSNYFSGVMTSAQPVNYAESGWNYWVDNRVYRPTGNTFRLWYKNGSGSWYADNTNSNPFYFTTSRGYAYLACDYRYFIDGAPAGYQVNPVTCQGNT